MLTAAAGAGTVGVVRRPSPSAPGTCSVYHVCLSGWWSLAVLLLLLPSVSNFRLQASHRGGGQLGGRDGLPHQREGRVVCTMFALVAGHLPFCCFCCLVRGSSACEQLPLGQAPWGWSGSPPHRRQGRVVGTMCALVVGHLPFCCFCCLQCGICVCEQATRGAGNLGGGEEALLICAGDV